VKTRVLSRLLFITLGGGERGEARTPHALAGIAPSALLLLAS
jgi:hypothetical protein